METSSEVLSQIKKYLRNTLGREPSDAEILEMIDSLYHLGRAINRYLRQKESNNSLFAKPYRRRRERLPP